MAKLLKRSLKKTAAPCVTLESTPTSFDETMTQVGACKTKQQQQQQAKELSKAKRSATSGVTVVNWFNKDNTTSGTCTADSQDERIQKGISMAKNVLSNNDRDAAPKAEGRNSMPAIPKEQHVDMHKVITTMRALAQELTETRAERDELKKSVHELSCENEDLKKVYGDSLDDLKELRHQYESLFEEDYEFTNNIALANVITMDRQRCESSLDEGTIHGTSSSPTSANEFHKSTSVSVGSSQSKEIDAICKDLVVFMADIRRQG